MDDQTATRLTVRSYLRRSVLTACKRGVPVVVASADMAKDFPFIRHICQNFGVVFYVNPFQAAQTLSYLDTPD